MAAASPGSSRTVVPTADFSAAVQHLRQRLAEDPLPGNAAQVKMAPAYRADLDRASIAGKDCREAGVLALLYPEADSGQAMLVLTERHADLDDHAGQVSFPGGQREAGESLRETALREAYEEVALDPHAVDVLGPLTPLYIPPSNFCVHPFLGVTRTPPALAPSDAEVAAILHVPLATLLAPATLQRKPWALHGGTVDVPFFDVDGCPPIWGATSMMLSELLALF